MNDWLQLFLYFGILAVTARPLGLYIGQVLEPSGSTFLDPLLKPLEQGTYAVMGVEPHREQDWKEFAVSMLVFSVVTMLFTYAILRLQFWLPLNPQGFGEVADHLAFNTAASFVTNTNWQSYGGESTMSYFSQMVALASHNFWSAAVGIAVAAALVRGIAGNATGTVGNFWRDLVRITYYLLLPMSLVLAMALLSQGVIQNFSPYTEAVLSQPVAAEPSVVTQKIAQGPMASQVAIKMLGTNGGGFMNANAAHGFENPTPLSNFLQILAIFLIPSALTYYLGWAVKNQAHGWAIWCAMAIMFLIGFLVCWYAESAGNPLMTALGVDAHTGNMEGKEVRFSIFNSAFFACITTAASCGAVNSMHDSFMPLGGLVPMLNMQLGEVIFGGVGAGLYGILVFVVLAVFIAGLMVGRTPEYLGKKIEAFDVKAACLAILVVNFAILGFTGWACVSEWGLAGPNDKGPHGLSEIMYAFTSAAANNGSAFAGLTANTYWYNTTLGLGMLLGRFAMIVPVLALAGSLASKKIIPAGPGSFPVSGATFVVLLVGTVVLVGALTYFPCLVLGPILEHFLLNAYRTF
jgi:K+-transporting ATPase ATPase A chain